MVTTEALKPLKQPSAHCGAPKTKATLVRFKAADGTSLDGVMVGSGPVGVVLATSTQPTCAALAVRRLPGQAGPARHRHRPALLRPVGLPQGEARGRVVDDVAAAVAELRTAAPPGAWSARPWAARRCCSPARGCGLRSPRWSRCREADPTNRSAASPWTPAPPSSRATCRPCSWWPQRPYTPVADPCHVPAAKTRDKRLEVSPNNFDGLHGWGMLTDVSSGGISSAATTVTEFVAAHTGS